MLMKTCILTLLSLVSVAAAAANGPSRAPQGASEALQWLPSPPERPAGWFERDEMLVEPDGKKTMIHYDSEHPQGQAVTNIDGKMCEQMAVNTLRTSAPGEARVYDLLKDKDGFLFYVKCSRSEFMSSLTGAIHESVHMLRTQTGGYFLLNGSFLKAVEDDEGLMPPSKILALVDASDDKVQHYIAGDPDGSSGRFATLLDEFNAYTHTLEVTLRLPLQSMVAYERYSVLSMMQFVKLYAEVARKSSPRSYAALLRADRRHVIQVLWAQAQALLDRSCRHTPRQADEDSFTDVYKTADAGALAEVLGSYPATPASCR
jgi:hypothetical protein